ncbi:cardiolipin synthase [Pareuzebyella sediminis]|uniref:cardiolipin synthase n=1 Tax=Pareuzebyella sediminis TaxID=2607998 RepID=UPI0011EDF757|nr:cardiolipin synthase [Pareuzebyella sediminis]
MLYIFLVILYLSIASGIVMGLLVNGVRPSKTLAWLLAIFTIPVGGILLYLMVGRNRRAKKLRLSPASEQNTEKGLPPNLNASDRVSKIAGLIHKNSGFRASIGNDVIFLKDGRQTFASIFEALETAQEYIHLQYYIYEEGELAKKLLRLFERKIREGVQIRLIYDGIGSFSLSRGYLENLKSMGVEVYPFLPFRFGRFLTSLNYRNHRKVIVVDGRTAFTGGINISDKYLKGDLVLGEWHDMHLRIKGAAVYDLNQVFLADWKAVSGQGSLVKEEKEINEAGSSMVQIVSSSPDSYFSAIEQVYFSIITSANSYVYITNPYIIPGQSILTALETAALSGIDVRLLIAEKSDSRLVSWSVRSYFEPLLRSGVKINLFPEGFLHSKIMISDDEITSIGTANIDIRSFEQNYEVNALVYEQEFTRKMKVDFLSDCKLSRSLSLSDHEKRPWIDRLKEGVAKVFSPVL